MSFNVFVESPSPRATGHNARFGDLLVRTAEDRDGPIVTVTRNTEAERQDQAASVYEQVDDIGYTFARFNHTGGEGMPWYPPRSGKVVPELDPIRFFASRNLNIGREVDDVPYRVELSRAWELLDDTQTFIDTFASNESIYYAHSLTVTEVEDWQGTNPTTYTLAGSTGPILSIFGSRGDDVCVITTEGDMFVKPRGATDFDMAYEQGVDGSPLIGGWWVKGRVMAQRSKSSTIDTSELVEIALSMGGTAGTPVVTPTISVIDTFDANVWSIIDGSIAIVAALSNGELRSYVPQSDTAGTVPTLTIRGTSPMPTSETPYLLGYSSGKLLILTEAEGTGGRKRAYTAEILDERFDFVVGQLQLLREWANTTDIPDIRGTMVSTRNAIWWLINDTDTAMCELWNYDTISTGVVGNSEVGALAGIALASFQDEFGLIYDDKVWARDNTLYHQTGYLITPNINFGRVSDIAWLIATMNAENIGPNGGSISLFRSTDPDAIYDVDHPTWVSIVHMTQQSQSGGDFQLNGLVSEQISLKLVFNASGSAQDTPRLLRYSIRGLTTSRDWIVQVPINIGDVIEVPNRQPVLIPGWGQAVYDQLLTLKGKNLSLEIFKPPGLFQGIIDAITVQTDYIADRGSAPIMAMVTLRGSYITGGINFTGTNSYAQVEYALGVWATGESENEIV